MLIHLVQGQDSVINVISFNIRYPNPNDGIHYWDNRKELVSSIIQFYDADIIGVQEAHRRQLDELTAALPEYDWFGVCRTDGSNDPVPDNEFSAILYRRDRLAILDGNTFWLSLTPDKVASVGWDAAFPRIVTWVKFKDKKTGDIFFHFNTHFDHMGVQARNESAKLLLQKVKLIAEDKPVIISGDFNCGESDQPYLIITTDSEFKDAMKISKSGHHGPMTTFTGNFQPSGLIDHRIDFIFVNNKIEVLKHAVLSDSWNGRFASDHLPVFAKLVISEP